MPPPLISIVIPTCGRPQFLPEAVRSALQGMGEDVEVIVVPNGTDDSWKQSLQSFSSDRRVRTDPIVTAHANAARNHGLKLARGEYVRFLDDDDYLYPGASSHQCSLLADTHADICTGSIDTITDNGAIFGAREVPKTSDFVESILTPGHVSLPTAHVFRRSAIKGLQWDETVSLAQDKHWMYQLCEYGEWQWVRTDRRVGVWRHHFGPRITGNAAKNVRFKIWVDMLFHTIEKLSNKNRLSASRRNAGSAMLWRIICGNYFMDTRYWDKVLYKTQHLFPETFPELLLYKFALGQLVPPRAILISTVPLQVIRRQIKVVISNIGLRIYTHPP